TSKNHFFLKLNSVT
nr:immunoglobulin heavy chain junction region [Mus musculus]